MSPHNKHIKNLQKGSAMVEFAIVVPLLLLLVLGIIEFGYGFYHLNILNKSVQDGTRYFSDSMIARTNASGSSLSFPINVSSTNTYISNNNVRNLVVYGQISAGTANTQLLPGTAPSVTVYCAVYSGSTLTISTGVCAAPITEHIMVQATYNHNFILGTAISNFFPVFSNTVCSGCVTLTASSVLRVE